MTSPHPLRVAVFEGGWNLPLWVAESQGYFADQGLDVELRPTPNSASLVSGLFDGRHDIALAGADNFVAFHDGSDTIAPHPDLFMFFGGDSGFLSLVAAPEVTEIAALPGLTVAVDAMTTGFAFVVRELLERAGVAYGDVVWTGAGGTNQRYAALLARQFSATLLRTPFDLLAREKGFQTLGSGCELGRYQGTVAATTRGYAALNESTLLRFIRAYRAGLDWCFDEANRSEVEATLERNVEGLGHHLTSSAASHLLDPTNGFTRDMRIDEAGFATVLRLRAKFGAPSADRRPSVAAELYDHSLLEKALRVR